MNLQNSLEINIDRLWNDIYETSKIGKGKTTGLSRLTLSDSDRDIRKEFI